MGRVGREADRRLRPAPPLVEQIADAPARVDARERIQPAVGPRGEASARGVVRAVGGERARERVEEDGVDNSDVDNALLYTQPEEVYAVYEALSSVPKAHFTVAAAFGCTPSSASPGGSPAAPREPHEPNLRTSRP